MKMGTDMTCAIDSKTAERFEHTTPAAGSVFRVGYYLCKAKASRNAEFPIHVLFAYDKDWPESVLRQRGLLGNRLLDREPTQDEIDIRESKTRAWSMKYHNIDSLIEDERRVGVDESFIDQLRSAFTPNAKMSGE